jgi:hypothetical protein
MSIAEWKGRALSDIRSNRWFYLAVFALLGAGWMMRFEVVAWQGRPLRAIIVNRFTGDYSIPKFQIPALPTAQTSTLQSAPALIAGAAKAPQAPNDCDKSKNPWCVVSILPVR